MPFVFLVTQKLKAEALHYRPHHITVWCGRYVEKYSILSLGYNLQKDIKVQIVRNTFRWFQGYYGELVRAW